MVHNPETLELATYYRKQGFSYTEIAKLCGISKSTVSNWFKDKAFSKKIAKANAVKAAKENSVRIALVNKGRQAARSASYKDALRAATTEYRHYKSSPLFIAGLMLYLGEGDNTHRRLVRIANARPEVHVMFLKFAKAYLGVESEQIKFWLLLYPDLQEKDCVAFWSKKLRLTPTNFYKNQVITGKSQKRTLQYGVGNTIIGSTILKLKLMHWIALATKDLSK